MVLTDPVAILPFVGPKQAAKMQRLGLSSLNDLLYHIPNYYKDTSNIVTLEDLTKETRQTVKVVIEELRSIRIRGGRTMQKGKVSDSSSTIEVTWFNQPFLPRALPIGSEAYLSGKLSPKSIKPVLVAPDYELVKDKNINLGKIAPVYPLTEGVSIKWLRGRMSFLLDHMDAIKDLSDPLSPKFKEAHQLIDLKDALKQVHSPESEAAVIAARKRLAFDELLQIYFKLIAERNKRESARTAKIVMNSSAIDDIVAKLPFTLTKSQLTAIKEIHTDLQKKHPMNRLLQGDVGSGKTIVALLAAIPVMASGYQAVIMAPTSVLAQQHYATIKKILGDSFRIALVTAHTYKTLDTSEPYQLIIATHSVLFHQKELLKKLGLLIIDEQHRFGVNQRQALLELKTKGLTPHLLNLTATPIPRSIALTLFGEIDVSVIERPAGRKQSKTLIVPQAKRGDSVPWIAERLGNGGQIFWICPLIEESTTETVEATEVKAAETWFVEVKKMFPKFRTALVHGRLPAAEKDKIIQAFKDHEIDILVATTVVEVGIDIPGANVIIIENAEKYGLAQLHQLRGRVGRNDQEAWCLLYTGLENNQNVVNRLQFFAREVNGIKIAEYDLGMRGPGEVYGTIQSGIPNLKVANFGNIKFLEEVRAAALELLAAQ